MGHGFTIADAAHSRPSPVPSLWGTKILPHVSFLSLGHQVDRENKRASQHLLLQEHDNSVLEGTHTLTHKPSKGQKYSAIMSGDMNWDEEKS